MKAKKVIVPVLVAALVLIPLAVKTARKSETTTKTAGKVITIENDYLKRELTIDENDHVLTSAVVNKRIDKTLVPGEGSEDFVINTIEEQKTETPILSSELVYDAAETDDSVEGQTKVTISYKPYELNQITYTIKQIFELKDEDHYMRSYLEIATDKPELSRIDYIDIDRFVLPEDAEGIWSRPADEEISSMWIGQHELMLGQPIYVDGMFMGSEFPETDNSVADNETQIRYYSGKTFAKLAEDNQLTEAGTYVTWPNVIGAARGTETAVVQTDFFDYIEDIATPTAFRKQYNSWYDNMMSITDESIAKSFDGAEAGLAKQGVEPLDAYVIDDGWNNYYDGKYTQPTEDAGSGTPNQTGFWEFNNKFPNELYTSSELVSKFDAAFGLWVGPQGGYSYFPEFGQFLEDCGTGELQSGDFVEEEGWNNVCTGSRLYLNNFEKRFIDYQTRFDIGYWKWDGFAVRPCTNENHQHMVGGQDNMYFTSDMWEAWIDVFEHTREARAAEGKDLWINATCYVNLSPWMLQWVNTVWIQDSGDTGQAGTGERHEQKIYYRDNVYYKLAQQNQVQFPMEHYYNHDPIYGVSDKSEATTDVFREYLMANAVRGTAFWELYYSPSMIDEEKWQVTADVLDFAESNHNVLKKAKLFGNAPKAGDDYEAGVYGYSSWNGAEGIISFTNPLDTVQEYTLTVDGKVGASEEVQNLKGIQVEPYKEGELEGTLSYGDDVTVSLEPHETIIYQYGHQDTEAPKLLSAKTTGENELTLRFNERIQNAEFTVDGKAAKTELQADYRTVVLTTDDKLQKDAQVQYTVEDFGANKAEETVAVAYYKDGVIAKAAAETTAAQVIDTENQLKGTEDFGIKLNVQTESAGVSLFDSNDGEVRLSINKEGFVEFKVKDAVLSSKEEVTTVTEKAHGIFGTDEYVPTKTEVSVIGQVNDGKAHMVSASREANGMLKLYIDGRLAATYYDEANRNVNLQGGVMTVLDEALDGAVSKLEVRNSAFAYDETK